MAKQPSYDMVEEVNTLWYSVSDWKTNIDESQLPKTQRLIMKKTAKKFKFIVEQ